ncbi:hypothetical protein N7510_008944 [Penicillium lagena]|uniref:uncharacterized protein n=1 Tax=Penicillium lagena TaxID=94218 RepID=UPI00254019B7|nr:uncharacterized protein N7510_008944 [Penicillium lagena]KAJ5606163.1 hypothetical protein N7510_008944 [Penicillium lagena]
MHKVLVPKRSGVHRFACRALYRALLRQCSPSVGNAPWLGEAKSLMRQKFRQYQGLNSPSQTRNALKTGYSTLDLLHSACKGNKHDEDRITTILAKFKAFRAEYVARQRELAESQPPKQLGPKQIQKQERIRKQNETTRRHPDAESIFLRPRPVVSGKRRVPVLVSARGVPFLRFKKPQPRNLSGVIRNKLDRRQKWIDRRDRLQVELLFAGDEDVWDDITNMEDSVRWTEELYTAFRDVKEKTKNEDMKNKEMAEKMWQIVLAERELAEKEERERQSER